MDGPEVETTLVDLTSASLDEVQRDFGSLREAVDLLLTQVERPRYNIGNTGPPGRAD